VNDAKLSGDFYETVWLACGLASAKSFYPMMRMNATSTTTTMEKHKKKKTMILIYVHKNTKPSNHRNMMPEASFLLLLLNPTVKYK